MALLRQIEEEREHLNAENLRLRKELGKKYSFSQIIGNSRKMQEVFYLITQVAKSNATVLLLGESGTGKELVANAIHYNSLRAGKPLIKINCAALPANLVEAELFGHEKGAFTGASRQKEGKFELANGGTIFLDEIGSLALESQGKLLRVLQERELERLGGTKTIKVNVRLIAATNRDLAGAVETGAFREDLFYRLNVYPIYPAAPQGEGGGHPPAGRLFSGEVCPRIREGHQADLHACHRRPGAVSLAGKREGAGELHGKGRAPLRGPGDPRLSPAAHAPDGRAEPGPSSPSLSAEAVERFERELLIDALKTSRGNMRQRGQCPAHHGTHLRVQGQEVRHQS